ncbi:hypothetical protein Q6D67_20695 [Haliea sp. E1-2-M8]|uniref:hypothetical protein n=1 Tax=Haliea sp. E1-2-M8 TaxID=3064706 RepID=UPI0027214910|nr:hypothetical protein [Haliea sp. E1-2-M8]MDO8864110.1 hypothetical protein [Haliea sp. E1-2-M8]
MGDHEDYYFVHTLRHGDSISKPFLNVRLRRLVLVAAVIVALTYFGYGLDVIEMWFVPFPLILLLHGFSFFWPPHVLLDVLQ